MTMPLTLVDGSGEAVGAGLDPTLKRSDLLRVLEMLRMPCRNVLQPLASEADVGDGLALVDRPFVLRNRLRRRLPDVLLHGAPVTSSAMDAGRPCRRSGTLGGMSNMEAPPDGKRATVRMQAIPPDRRWTHVAAHGGRDTNTLM